MKIYFSIRYFKKITIYCNENGYFVKYLSDRYGFNNDDNLWDEGNKNIVLGDHLVMELVYIMNLISQFYLKN